MFLIFKTKDIGKTTIETLKKIVKDSKPCKLKLFAQTNCRAFMKTDTKAIKYPKKSPFKSLNPATTLPNVIKNTPKKLPKVVFFFSNFVIKNMTNVVVFLIQTYIGRFTYFIPNKLNPMFPRKKKDKGRQALREDLEIGNRNIG